MRSVRPRLFLFAFLQVALAFTAQAQVPAIASRYVGVLRHPKLKRDQLAKIDFIFSREDESTTAIKAILTLHFGDFKSGEYVAYDFDDVKYSVLEKAFIFSEKEHGVTIVAKQLTPLEFSGEFSSLHSGEIGTLHLRSDTPVAPQLPLLDPIWGEYRGKCLSTFQKGKKVDTVVQLYTYRSSIENSEVSNNAFRSYNIKGFIGEDYEKGCFLRPGSKKCLLANIDGGTYNFFENQLFIYCNVRDMRCIPEKGGLTCERCEFLKRVSPVSQPAVMTPPAATPSFPAPSPQPSANTGNSSLGGAYRGYLHHEYLDIYQAAQLNIVAFQTGSTEDPQLNLAANATLYFGDLGSTESIPYHFAPRTYPKPLSVAQFTFGSPDPTSNIDAILQVSSIGDGVAKGVWFSRLFGRVGTFELYRDKVMVLPNTALKMELVSGNYDGTGLWDYDLLIKQNSVQSTTQNPFAPMTFAGYQLFRTGRRDRLTGGSYDFFTGRISFEATDEAGERTHIGQRSSRRKLLLNTMERAILTPVPPFALQAFKLVGSRN